MSKLTEDIIIPTNKDTQVSKSLCIVCKIRSGELQEFHCQVCDTVFGRAYVCSPCSKYRFARYKILQLFKHTH